MSSDSNASSGGDSPYSVPRRNRLLPYTKTKLEDPTFWDILPDTTPRDLLALAQENPELAKNHENVQKQTKVLRLFAIGGVALSLLVANRVGAQGVGQYVFASFLGGLAIPTVFTPVARRMSGLGNVHDDAVERDFRAWHRARCIEEGRPRPHLAEFSFLTQIGLAVPDPNKKNEKNE
eukprot:TRINITY_DN695_c0_g1_i1.p1 TRINITY_DN695_c0_g1~~TRINITY_DN695_c0_g1_i1.p1  ORF type:complete len:196 (-),score=38.33 TRINITY_DN695_c0_g1_i1:33-566(-)